MNRMNGRMTGHVSDPDMDLEPSCLVYTPSGNVYIPSGNPSEWIFKYIYISSKSNWMLDWLGFPRKYLSVEVSGAPTCYLASKHESVFTISQAFPVAHVPFPHFHIARALHIILNWIFLVFFFFCTLYFVVSSRHRAGRSPVDLYPTATLRSFGKRTNFLKSAKEN